jgi:Protein of unknown function (DUF3307)
VSWAEVLVVFAVCHLVGDFLFQTEWQAVNKFGGLRPVPVARRALLSHVATYTIAFFPAFVWIANERGSRVWGAVALVAIPHLLQDDGRALLAYMRRVKRSDAGPGDLVFIMADQSLHSVALLAAALAAAG